MAVVLFEDEQVAGLRPATVGRPAYAITCGALSLYSLLADQPLRSWIRPYLLEMQAIEFPQIRPVGAAELDRMNLWVNARLVPSLAARSYLRGLTQAPAPRLAFAQQQLAAAWLPREIFPRDRFAPGTEPPLSELPGLRESAAQVEQETPPALSLLDYPHQVVERHLQLMREGLEWRIARGEFQELAEGVYAAAGVRVASHVATDTRRGPILLDSGCSLAPFCVLEGPVYVGPGSRVNPHATLRDAVYLGPTTRAGGEIEATLIEGFSNKQHHGFLGHSYLGRWINLGAGTCNSNLKNTYGPIAVDYDGQKVDTGMQFFGCVIGDYTKTAINTGIFTGKLIGCCSMVYGFVTNNVPSFTNYARSFGQMTELAPAVLVETQRRMFQRRGFEQQEYHRTLLMGMYQETEAERRLASRPLWL
jgi:glucose-1-phosphate thymidylyltransferase